MENTHIFVAYPVYNFIQIQTEFGLGFLLGKNKRGKIKRSRRERTCEPYVKNK